VEVQTGELLADRPGFRVTLLADMEDLGATITLASSGIPSPPMHVHDRHADCFLVLEGSLRLELEGETRVAGPQTWIQVPQGVVHTFGQAGDEPARIVNVHTPSGGIGAYMRALMAAETDEDRRRAWEGFDGRPLASGGADPSSAVVCRLGGAEGETVIEREGRRVTLVADTEELAVTESVYGPGERGPDPHVHREHADAWLVLEGTLSFELRDRITVEAPAGTLVVVPRNVAHGFWNERDEVARFLNIHAPACGFGDYMRGTFPDFDQHDPPPDGGLDPGSVLVCRF
jgi:quercetin dioxygenase-like cupin family protein